MRTLTLSFRDDILTPLRHKKSALICEELERYLADAFAAKPEILRPRIAVYEAMRSEVNLAPFINNAYQRGWDICFPCMVRQSDSAESSRMAFFHIDAHRYSQAQEDFLAHPLRCHACSALENEGYSEVSAESLDAVVVPLVAFDGDNNRLGYGGGNYDKFLPLLRPGALVVGVAFAEQRVDSVPCEPHDRPLPRIISA